MPSPTATRYREQLGLSYPAASYRLIRKLLFSLLVESKRAICLRCKQPIDSVEDMTIDHMIPWRNKADAQELFYDIENIAFSHPRCNSSTLRERCRQGHLFADDNVLYDANGARRCRTCNREKMRRAYHRKKKQRG